jgi:PAS domain S-box-containing protein
LNWIRFNFRLSPLRIAVFYACIGGIWLLLISTRIITALFLDPTAFKLFEVNNTIFILVTAWLLYFLIRKSESGINRSKDALSRLNRTLKAYSECHQALIRDIDEMKLMHNICRTIVEVGGYRVAWVGIAENNLEKSILPVAQWGDKDGYLKNLNANWSDNDRGRGPTGTAIKTGKPVVVQYIKYDPKWELWREKALSHGFYSSISLPLVTNGRSFAALVIFSGETRPFDKDEVKLLSELADDLSYGITTLRAAIESRKVEKEYRLLASVIEQAKEGIFLFDGEGVIQYVNHAVETITGLPPWEMIGHNIHMMECEGPNRVFYGAIIESISRGEEHAGYLQYKRVDGVVFELDVTTWSVSDIEGNIISYVALIRDVTHEMQLERQLRHVERMEAIGTLAGGIAHDFNNTLASIITCSEMALDECPDGSTLQELLDVILKSGLRGRNLVKQILTFSRQGEQEPQEVEVELIVSECLKLLRASMPASIEIRLNLGKELGKVFADPTQIQQIVMNLCTNADHAMHGRAHGVMEIWLDNADLDCHAVTGFGGLQPGRYLRLMVKDNGHGMDESTMERIFDPFFSTKGPSEGTGLGLSVIHGIVSKRGGAILVESKEGEGTLFTVYLPRIETPKQTTVNTSPIQILSGNECILLVDDEEDIVFGIERTLKQLGYRVVTQTDPHEALKLFQSEPDQYDLVITDQSMPRMSGIELARELNQIRPNIPIILCTGYDPVVSGAETGDGEPAEFIRELAMKPLIRAEISAIIRRVLDKAPDCEEAHG